MEMLEKLRIELVDLLDGTKQKLNDGKLANAAKSDIEQFIDGPVGSMFKVTAIYGKLFAHFDVPDYVQWQAKMKRLCRQDSDISEELDSWCNAEIEWNQFLKDVDTKYWNLCTTMESRANYTIISIGQLDAGSGVQQGLGYVIVDRCDELHVVGYGSLINASLWKQETGSNLDILVDKNRHLYRALNLKRSVLATWSIESLRFYAEQIHNGKEMPKANMEGGQAGYDFLQMGGDLILDRSAKVHYLYRSQTSVDRPSVEILLKAIE